MSLKILGDPLDRTKNDSSWRNDDVSRLELPWLNTRTLSGRSKMVCGKKNKSFPPQNYYENVWQLPVIDKNDYLALEPPEP
jgi:hypothetical protein